MKPARKFAQVSRRFYRPEQFHVSRTQGFRYAREMLPVLHPLLSQLGNQKRAVRLCN